MIPPFGIIFLRNFPEMLLMIEAVRLSHHPAGVESTEQLWICMYFMVSHNSTYKGTSYICRPLKTFFSIRSVYAQELMQL